VERQFPFAASRETAVRVRQPGVIIAHLWLPSELKLSYGIGGN
jgi:hypothetical protein